VILLRISDEQILDLYSGPGGLGTGFAKYFNVVAAVDFNQDACKTYHINHNSTRVYNRKVSCFIDSVIPKDFDGILYKNIKGVIGGPPCQEFSRLNQQKKYLSERANQMLVMIDAIIQMKPRFALIENVATIPDTYKHLAIKKLSDVGFRVVAKIINANKFGSVQTRRRWILTACKTQHIYPEPNPSRRIAQEIVTDNVNDIKMEDCVREKLAELPSGKWRPLPGQTWKGYYIVDPAKPLPAVINILKNRLIHPNRQQYLCWADCIASQGFPRDYEFYGGITSRAQQLANAVPVELAESFSKAFFNPTKNLECFI
jgi:DNA (cytosine-5)-methyltransferase 1